MNRGVVGDGVVSNHCIVVEDAGCLSKPGFVLEHSGVVVGVVRSDGLVQCRMHKEGCVAQPLVIPTRGLNWSFWSGVFSRVISFTLLVLLLLVEFHWQLPWRSWLWKAHVSYSRSLFNSLTFFSPSPLGFKLEPRLSFALAAIIRFYMRMYSLTILPHLLFSSPSPFFSPPFVLALFSCLSSLIFHMHLLSALTFFALFLTAIVSLPVSLLALLAARSTVFLWRILRSLSALSRGRYRSQLRHREEPLDASVDSLMLGMLILCSCLMLAPAVVVHTLLLVLYASPCLLSYIAFKWTLKKKAN